MNKKVYLDTNILLDFLDETRVNNNSSKELLYQLTLHNYQIFISEDMITTVFYIDKQNTRVLNFLKSIVCRRWNISAFGTKTINKAIDLSLEHNLDLEDTLQCFCAKDNGCEVLLTNDKKFYNCGIKIETPKSFLDSLK